MDYATIYPFWDKLTPGEQIVALSRGKIRILEEDKLRKCVSS